MFLGNNILSKKHEATNFLLVFYEQNYVKDLGNVPMVPNFIYDSHTIPRLF